MHGAPYKHRHLPTRHSLPNRPNSYNIHEHLNNFQNSSRVLQQSFIGERERANLVVRQARFFYVYVCMYVSIRHICCPLTVMFYVTSNFTHPSTTTCIMLQPCVCLCPSWILKELCASVALRKVERPGSSSWQGTELERRASETAETRERRLARDRERCKVQRPGSSGWQGTELDSESVMLLRLWKHVTVG